MLKVSRKTHAQLLFVAAASIVQPAHSRAGTNTLSPASAASAATNACVGSRQRAAAPCDLRFHESDRRDRRALSQLRAEVDRARLHGGDGSALARAVHRYRVELPNPAFEAVGPEQGETTVLPAERPATFRGDEWSALVASKVGTLGDGWHTRYWLMDLDGMGFATW